MRINTNETNNTNPIILYPICKLCDVLFGRFLPQGLPVLLYHSIDDRNTPLAISKEKFEEQMKYLHDAGYETIKPQEITNLKNYRKKIIITFDDGWQDNLTNAAPILSDNGYFAVLFMVSDYIGQKGIFAKNTNDQDKRMLDAAEIKGLDQRGWIIANHFASHRSLDKLSLEEIAAEFRQCRERLAEIVGYKESLACVSYPHNCLTGQVEKSLKDSGAAMGFGGRRRFYYSGDDMLDIPRIEIYPDTDLIKFKLKLSGTYNILRKFIFR